MGSDRIRAEGKKSSSPIPGNKPKQFSFLQPRYQHRVETDSVQENKQQNSPEQATPTPALSHSFGRVSVRPIQAKLMIGQPGDKYEQEAEQVAEQVMRMPEPKIQRVCPKCEDELQRQPMEEEEETLQTKPLADQITPLVQRQAEPMEEEEEEETLQTKTASGRMSTVSSSLQNRITALRGGGEPLTQSERAFFEPRFGADFSQVRVHADSQAAETAHAVNARAFTLGQDIVFGTGQYQPRSSDRQRLLAHELTHVVQQSGTGSLRRMSVPVAERKSTIDISIQSPFRYQLSPAWQETLQRNKKKISTPYEPKKFKKSKGGTVKAQIGGVDVTIMPDKHKVKKLGNKAHTGITRTWKHPSYSYDKKTGKILSVSSVPPPDVKIQSAYGDKVTPASKSAYGRGTTPEEIKAGKTSLGHHEGSHGSDFLDHLKKHPIPKHKGKAGMSKKAFDKASQDYDKEMKDYFKKMENLSKKKTDCVGIKADFCEELEKKEKKK